MASGAKHLDEGTGGRESAGAPPANEPSRDANREMSDFERSTIRLATVAVLMSGAAALFMCLQWYEMHTGSTDTKAIAKAAGEQAAAAGKQADEAKEQVSKIGESLAKTDALIEASNRLALQASNANRLTEESIRGRIAIKNVRLGKPVTLGEQVTVLVETENVGHSAALERGGESAERWQELPDGEMPVKVPGASEATTMEPGSGGLVVVLDKEPVTESFLSALGDPKPGFQTTFFFGRIVYETLGKEHYTEFCAYLMPFNTSSLNLPETKANAGFNTDKRYALRECPRWHGSD